MSEKFSYQQIMTPEDVYGFSFDTIRTYLHAGQEFVAFRPPKVGETFMSKDGMGTQIITRYDMKEPRLIIGTVEPEKPIRFLLESRPGEERRRLKDGEFGMLPGYEPGLISGVCRQEFTPHTNCGLFHPAKCQPLTIRRLADDERVLTVTDAKAQKAATRDLNEILCKLQAIRDWAVHGGFADKIRTLAEDAMVLLGGPIGVGK